MTMAKLAPPKKGTKPTAPKKPTSRSKTGNAACSSAASNWQLALRGKAALDPETYRTLAKCRAMNRTAKMAEAQGRTGKLSAMGESAVKARLQARFDSGLITQKSRTDKLNLLLKQRSERGKNEARNSETKSGRGYGDLTKDERTTFDKSILTPFKEAETEIDRIRNTLGERYAWEAMNAGKIRYPNQSTIDRFSGGAKQYGIDFDRVMKDSGVEGIRKKIEDAKKWGEQDWMEKPAKKADAFALKPPPTPGISTRSQGVMFGTDTELDKIVRAEQAAKPKPLAGQGNMFDVSTQRLAPAVMAPRVLAPAAKIPLKSVAKAVKGKLVARAERTSGVATLRTESIKADPERFQYKMNTSGPVGVTDQFKETKTWNRELAGVVQVWKDPANGQTFVVNGHHRYELAQRLGVKRLNVQYIQAKDAAEARTKGALTNIAEGRGTSVDAGKFFREQGDLGGVVETLKKKGISLSEKTASEGLALAKTAPKIWRDVVDEMTPVSRAVAIGKADLRHEDQLQIYRKATEGNWRSGKVEEFATELKRAPLVKSGSASLFGDDEFVNTAEHRAALADRFKTQLKSGKKLFGTVARSRNAGRLESAGNKIDRESSAAIAQSNDRALMAFDIERKFGSRTSRLLDRYATQLAQGEKIDRVYGGFEARVTRALQRDLEKPFEARLAKRKARLAAMAR